MANKFFLLWILIIGLMVFSGCVKTINPDIERGSDYIYREGYPDVRISALGYLNIRDEAVIEVTTEIGYGSLVYETVDDQEVATVQLAIRVSQNGGIGKYLPGIQDRITGR